MVMVEQLKNQVLGLEALRNSKELLAQSFKDELGDTQTLLDQGFSEKTLLRQAERNFATFSGEAAELTANIAATEVQIGETELQILQQDSEFQNEKFLQHSSSIEIAIEQNQIFASDYKINEKVRSDF